MLYQTALLALVGLTSAAMPGLKYSRQAWGGVATFNNYQAQGHTVCGPLAGQGGTYGAAAGDISPDIGGGTCYAQIDYNNCQGQSPYNGYQGPACPTGNCGTCYTVTNQGGYGGAYVGGVGKSIVVQIIDSCPSVSAWNYCKTDVSANERCGDGSTNSLDIDQNAYQALTGTAFYDGVPNLQISITPGGC